MPTVEWPVVEDCIQYCRKRQKSQTKSLKTSKFVSESCGKKSKIVSLDCRDEGSKCLSVHTKSLMMLGNLVLVDSSSKDQQS